MLIAFEGGEGSGKSTQARLLATRLGAVLTFEPGGTALGAELRALLLDGGDVDPRAEALLMAADRAQHRQRGHRTGARPRPARGDRSLSLFVARVPGLMDEGSMWMRSVRCRCSPSAPEADLVILLTIPAELRRERLQGKLDRIEAGDEVFHERVESGFLELAARDRSDGS